MLVSLLLSMTTESLNRPADLSDITSWPEFVRKGLACADNEGLAELEAPVWRYAEGIVSLDYCIPFIEYI